VTPHVTSQHWSARIDPIAELARIYSLQILSGRNQITKAAKEKKKQGDIEERKRRQFVETPKGQDSFSPESERTRAREKATEEEEES